MNESIIGLLLFNQFATYEINKITNGEGTSNRGDYDLEDILEEPLVYGFREFVVEAPLISLHALTRENTYQTIRVKAYIGKHTVHSLIDYGRTHTFLDLKVAKKLGCKFKAICPMDVSAANRQIMSSLYECKEFKWTFQGVEFTSDVLILPLGDIKWDFKDLVMDFVYNNKRMQIAELLESHQDVFATPTSLLPKRKQDYRIPLLPNTPPINIRPYKNPPNQKDVVEAMLKELMESGVIRDKQSPYSHPIVMVKKKDGTWRKCYHQIRMHEDDIKKTTFRTHEGHYEFIFMPFGLTNAPSTFQSLMNTVFKSLLRRLTLIFFDDILVYSAILEEHLQHLQFGLQAMKHNSLYAKMTKCIFAAKQVEYLGHIIFGVRVLIDLSKIIAMQNWPTSANVKQLKGFLGLTGYYRRFVRNYAIISKPLTTLLKKNSFSWNPSAQAAFEELKLAMIQALILALPDFNQLFTVETGFRHGNWAVLWQGGHPIAYLSKYLSPKHQALSTYEKEFYAVLMALEKWRGYLLDRHFKLKTNHFSLKYFLDPTLTTPS
ncbi:retrovirus-related pol polyprotein from transposon 17.6 [Tanacetum coccineum]|uniref:Retrovirus-related pol polyprotein from transposon 17.6 n=1 Tax=Tanacetum coccineum TaxID=301880 RepID=A0ABQ4XR10_9ASTR